MLQKYFFILIIAIAAPSLAIPVNPGDPCDPILNDCRDVPQTQCLPFQGGGFTCQCNSGLITDTVDRRCIHPPEKPGDPCARDGPPVGNCGLLPNTICEIGDTGKHVCKCAGDFVTLPGRCLARPGFPGEECFPSLAECTGITNTACAVLDANQYYCKCTGQLVTDVAGKQCLTKPEKPGQDCHPTLTPCEGVGQTTCSLNLEGKFACMCIPGYLTDTVGGRCLKIPTAPGDSCDPTLTPCAGVSRTTCSTDDGGASHYCKCTGDLVTDPANRECLEKPQKPGHSCHPILTPCGDIDNTVCLQDSDGGDYYCKCIGDYVTDLPAERCLKKPILPGDECLVSIAPCTLVENTECSPAPSRDKFICTCNAPFVTDIAHSRCVPYPTLPGDACVTDLAPCSPVVRNTTCEEYPPHPPLCKCTAEFVMDLPGKRCLKIPTKPGQSCEPGFTDCSATIEPSVCAESEIPNHFFCKCTDPDVVTDPTAEICLKIPTKPGDRCHVTLAACVGVTDTTCKSAETGGIHSCICDDPLVTDPSRGRCLSQPTLPGDHCEPNLTPCDDVPNTICTGESCICTGDLVTYPEYGICLTAPQKPGDLCHPVDANCAGIPNTDCLDDNGFPICKCTGDLVTDPVKGQCLTVPTNPGDLCDPILTPCTDVEETECKPYEDKFICYCNVPLITDTVNRRCITYPTMPGHACEVNIAHCALIPNTTCEPFPPHLHLCKCADAFVTHLPSNRCVLIPKKPGQICEPGITDCTLTSDPTQCAETEDDGFICKCTDPEFVTDPEGESCLKIPIKPGDNCHVTLTPCLGIDNTTCELNPDGNTYSCTCIDPLVTDPNQGRCLVRPTLPGDHCDPAFTPCDDVPNTNCEDYCVEHCCKCTGDLITFPEKGICLLPPQIPGDLCHPTLAHCNSIENTRCEEVNGTFICNCTNGLVLDPENGVCLTPPQKPGDFCDPILTPCTDVNLTECLPNGVGQYYCECHPEYITDVVNGRCIRKPLQPGDECLIDLDLCYYIANTTCIDDLDGRGPYCKCNGDFNTDGGKCFNTPTRPGDTCGPNTKPCTDPLVQNTTCEDDGSGFYCKCINGYFTDFILKACSPHPLNPGDYCDPNNLESTCGLVANTRCSPVGNGIHRCECIAGYFQDGACHLLPTKPLDRCAEQSHCESAIPNTICELPSPDALFKICRCEEFYDPNMDLSRCIRKAEFVNDPCETNIQCSLLSNTRCTFEPTEGFRCTCIPGNVPNADKMACLPIIRELGANCTEDVQCSSGIGENAECPLASRVCNCKTGYVGNANRDVCLETVYFGDRCEVDGQCTANLGQHSLCSSSDKICECKSFSSYLNYFCHERTALFSPCNSSEECVLGVNEHAYCNGVCRCQPEKLVWGKSCYADLSIGSPCAMDAQCFVPVPYSKCQNATCTCELGLWSSSNGKICSGTKGLMPGYIIFLVLLSIVAIFS